MPCKSLFGVTEIETSTSAENIQAALSEYIKFTKLDMSNLGCIVRDDASNVKKAAKLMNKPS